MTTALRDLSMCPFVVSGAAPVASKFHALATGCSGEVTSWSVRFQGLPSDTDGGLVAALSRQLQQPGGIREGLGVCGTPSVGALASLAPVVEAGQPVRAGAQVP